MTVLVFTATYADAMRPETAASVQAQQADVPWVWEVSRHNPYSGVRDLRNVVAQYQRAWEMALAGGYDALLTVEHDMVLPANALQRLYETDAPVVYGVYTLRHGPKTLNAWRYENRRNLGMSLSLYRDDVDRARRDGWIEVCGVGWGCTLVRREVIERLQVRQSGDNDAGDLAFATDCVRAGIRQIARFDVPCGHIEPDGNVLDPFRDGGIVSRVLATVDVNVNADGQTVEMKRGRYYTLPVDVAVDMQRAGYCIVTNDTDERETAVTEPVAETAMAPKTRRKRGSDAS